MSYRYVITTDREVDVDDIGAHLSAMEELGEHQRHWDIRLDDEWSTIRCAGEAHDTFAKLLAQIEGYCVRIRTEDGEEFDAVLIRAPGLVRRVDDDCNPIADHEEVSIGSVYVY
jgi:hypothetical protein